ncbi:MAG: DNA alkylation repair protein [Bacteroidales bacterium]|nr:DNA alkylation repair protein [Bacteroidales bacterium]
MIEEMLQPLVSVRFATEPKYRDGHIRIINALQGRRIIGLHVPDMKKVAKELARREDAAEIIRGFEKEAADEAAGTYGSRLTYEETVVWGLMINAMKVTWEQRAEMLRKYVPVLDNWAVCDTFCCNAKWVTEVPQCHEGAKTKGKCTRVALWNFLQPYWRSKREFEVRFAIVMSMIYFLDAEWFPEVCRMLDGLDYGKIQSCYRKAEKGVGATGTNHHPAETIRQGRALGESPYYVRMSVAWLLATALAKIPDETRAYVNTSALPSDVKRLYVRKARESFRTRIVSPF